MATLRLDSATMKPLQNLHEFILRSSPQGFGGPYYGTEYSMENACRSCGVGAIPVGPLVRRATDQRPGVGILQTLDQEYLVSDTAALRLNEFTGLALWPTTSPHGEKLPWYMIRATTDAAPPADLRRSRIARQGGCRKCGRSGFFQRDRSSSIVYDRTACDDLNSRDDDVIPTWEHFGVGRLTDRLRDSRFAQPKLLVSSRLSEVLASIADGAAEFRAISCR